ncbi:MAG TPA: TIGR01777 family oxidoreductase [Terriglobia bacterium]|nr:TIGR01777 family oxidoreductase [Terriglobia bacterium]
MKTVVLAGGSGFLGRSLAPSLSAVGYRVLVLSRYAGASRAAAETIRWDGKKLGAWCDALDGANAVVNLTGRSVNCRYTARNRREILDSRLGSVRLLGEAIGRCRRPPGVLVQASSLAIYGDAGANVCDERAASGSGFGAEVCLQWEAAVNSLTLPNSRTVVLRIGFALGRDGGALQTLAGLTRWFLGGSAGSGDQYISWIHMADLNEMFKAAMEDDAMQGVYNATGPEPVTNREFMRQLRSVMGRPWSPPVPSWAVRIGAFLMRTEASLALTGRRCVPARFLERGFRFQFRQLRPALADLL